jgi:hypothetical protein
MIELICKPAPTACEKYGLSPYYKLRHDRSYAKALMLLTPQDWVICLLSVPKHDLSELRF